MLGKKGLIFLGITILVIILIVFIYLPNEKTSVEQITPGEWINFELEDVATGEKFKISDFSNKPVLLESFAVWCPTCTRQQNEIKILHEELPDDFISISLNTDPNEDKEAVKKHLESNGFNWRYAIAPTDMTKSLISQFGIGIVNAPSAPVILICEDGTVRKLDSGLKRVDELKEEINKGC